MRGEDHRSRLNLPRIGIIPAGAGRRKRLWDLRTRVWDHPRGCGEKCRQDRQGRCRRGSSPRVRGEANIGLGGQRDKGIIPAGAGRRQGPQGEPGPQGDHPRGCGEKVTAPILRTIDKGSSPRVRGEEKAPSSYCCDKRIIPAGAGRRPRGECRCPRRWDHPRGCGEKRAGPPQDGWRLGSSPRVRGEAARFRPGR